jgi:hypothetical protein
VTTTPLSGGREIDVVVPGRVVRDDAERRPGRVEQLGVDRVGQHRHEPLRAGDEREQLGTVRGKLRVVQAEVEQPRELVANGLDHATGDGDDRRHAGSLSGHVPGGHDLGTVP